MLFASLLADISLRQADAFSFRDAASPAFVIAMLSCHFRRDYWLIIPYAIISFLFSRAGRSVIELS